MNVEPKKVLLLEDDLNLGFMVQENFELRRANEILKSASVFFAKELDQDRPR